ncbi:undecaprenyl diphosphate synthase family protein, partial [Mycobacterium tuberculosis]|nr:undecaprenyl diphosphate synthase family protein [Mycobacterium tuberculosis]
VAAGRLLPEQIDASLLGSQVALADLPPPDLFIRTGGDTRISNFLLWQSAYAELVFSDKLWPDWDRRDLWAAVEQYARRDRRFGGVRA